jgi:NADH-quinone oxidoreductase subunit E
MFEVIFFMNSSNNSSIFSEKLKTIIEKELTRYETKRSAILPICHAIQDECGWVQEKHIDALETVYSLNRIQVKEVLTFYKAYKQSEPKKFEIEFCDNIVCCMMGAKDAIAKIEELIEKQGVNSEFGLKGAPCLGVCDQAPAMLVNKDRHHKITNENVEKVLSRYSSTI